MAIDNLNPPCQPLRVSGDAIINAAGERVGFEGHSSRWLS